MTSMIPTPEAPTRRPGRKPDQAAAARDREARSIGGATELLSRRPELREVVPAASWRTDATLWSA